MHLAGQFLRSDRLAYITIHPSRQAAFAVAGHGMRREGNDGNVFSGSLFVANGRRCFKSIHVGHLDIHQNQVEGLLCKIEESLTPGGGYGDRMALFSSMRRATF